MPKRSAVVVGLDFLAQFLAELINEQSADWELHAYPGTRAGTLRALFALRHADALISFGGPALNTALAEAARRRNLPVFIIWAGNDVTKAQIDPFSLEVTKHERFINLCVAPWLIDELRQLGIEAEYLPAVAVTPGNPVKPLPSTFRVLTYLPEPRRRFYGSEMVYALANAMPDVPFVAVGKGSPDPDAPANVQFCGMVRDMPDRLDACTVLLREPQHDGQSMLVLEALARGRHVVWNKDFPHVRTARTFEEALAELTNLRELHTRGELETNDAGREFVLDRYARPEIASNLVKRLDEGVREWASRPKRWVHRVAISGLGLFCAEIGQYTKMFTPEWEPQFIRTSSRLDVLSAIFALAASDVWYSIGGPMPDRRLHLAAKLLRKPRVIHWVGSDIAMLSEDRSLSRTLQAGSTMHLAEVTWTAEQLRSFGLNPRIAPLPPRHRNCCAQALPETFTIMLYVPRTRAVFYGGPAFERLMRTFAGKPIRYIIVGGGSIDVPEGVEADNLGWRGTLTDAYERTSVLIRFTPRDGLSLMVLEALSFGRHVLWTQEFPHTRFIRTFSDMEREVQSLLDAHLTGTLKPQYAAAQMVLRDYNAHACMRDIAEAWSDVLSSPKRSHLTPMETT